MLSYALNELCERVNIKSAIKGENYRCEVCNSQLITKQGKLKVWHYSHANKKECDLWYEMTDWHRNWQNKFNDNNLEIVLKQDGKIHRADVKIGNIIIEFQNSSMSIDDFRERTEFYSKENNLIWVINMQNRKLIPNWIDFDLCDSKEIPIVFDYGSYLSVGIVEQFTCNIYDLLYFIKEYSRIRVITMNKYKLAENAEIDIWIDKLRTKISNMDWREPKGKVSKAIWKLEYMSKHIVTDGYGDIELDLTNSYQYLEYKNYLHNVEMTWWLHY